MKVELISDIVHAFYDRAKIDFMIGYHFRFIEDFDEHIPRIIQFWNLQLNNEISDRALLPFDLIEKHRPLGVKKGEVNRWVTLFFEELDKNKDISNEEKEVWKKKIHNFKEKIIQILIQP